MKKVKFKDSLIIISFLIILFAPLININKISGKISESEKRYLSEFPKLFSENGELITTGLRSGIENWLNDNIGFREEFVKLHSFLNLKLFNTSPNSRVEIGKDGWFYYTSDYNLNIANGTYPLSIESMKKIKDNQEQLNELLKNKGIDYALIVAPSKVSIYPEYIKSGDYSVRETPSDLLTEYIETNSDVKVINLKQFLLNAKDNEQVYLKTDSHWNEAGAYIAYECIINILNKYGWIDSKPVSVNRANSSYIGEFSIMMGDSNLLGEESTINTEIIDPKAERIHESSIGQANITYKYKNSSIDGKRVLIYGDSMFGEWNLPQLFAENFSEFVYVWSYEMLEETIDIFQPDIVLYEIAERMLYDLENKKIKSNTKTLINPQAEIISDTTLNNYKRDDSIDIEIVVKNTGDEIWTEENLVRLCIWINGHDMAYRLYLPDGVEVKPNELYTFKLTELPISEDGYIEYQMLQEGKMYFGDRKRIDIKIQ